MWGGRRKTLQGQYEEGIFIRVNDPSMNRCIEKYQLPHIWDKVLVNTPELK